MNLAKLSWKYIVDRPLNTFLNVLLFGFGIAIILVLLLVSRQMEDALTKNAKGINLVVAAKGSPLQIILCNIYHVDFPTGNIALEEAIELSKNSLIKRSIPLALGDSYRDYRIVGTTHAYADLYQVTPASGQLWGKHAEAVIGANVALTTGMKVGDEFATEHGMQSGGIAHDDHGMTVVGILERSGTVVDNLILTSVESVWEAHEEHDDHEAHEDHNEAHDDHDHDKQHDDHEHKEHHHDPHHDHEHSEDEMVTALGLTYHPHELKDKEITSLIVQYAGPMGAVRLPRMINEETNMQSASPAFETARLFTLIGTGVEVINGFAYLIIFIAGLSIFISLYNSLKQRTYDLAIMRAMGASSRFLFLHVIVESMIISFLGGVFGLILAHVAVGVIDDFFIPVESQVRLSALLFLKSEFIILALSFGVGIFAAVIPAISAYKTDISKTLARG